MSIPLLILIPLQTLLCGNTLCDKEKNTLILNATIEYILSTERFEEPLIY